MALTERLSLLIDAKTGGAAREFDKLSKKTDDLGASTKKTDQLINKMAGGVGVSANTMKAGLQAVGSAAVYFGVQIGVDAVRAASALNEQVSAAGVTFGSASEKVVKFSESTASALGISQREALKASNAFGAFFTGIGVGDEQAAKFSEGLVRLAGDLASFKDLGTEEVLEKLRSGLAGEAEPLRALGVFLNETSVKAKAMELGLGGAHRELTDGEKILARYALIIDQTGDAQGDAARTSDSFANKQRQLNAQLEDSKAKLGQGLLPIVATLATDLGNGATAADKAGNLFSAAFDKIGLSGEEVADSFLNAVPGIGQVRSVLGLVAGESEKTATTQERLAEVERELGLASGSLTNLLEPQVQTLEDTQKAAQSLASTFLASANADRSYAAAKRGVGEAEQRVADARTRLNDLMAKAVVDTRKVEDAERRLEAASRSVTDAQRGLADAQNRVADAEANLAKVRQGASARDLAAGDRAVRAAILGREQAERRLSQATQSVIDAQLARDPWALTDAYLAQEQAALDLERATADIVEAQERQNELLNYGKDGSDSLRDAERQLADAHRDLDDASRGVETAVRNQADAQRDLNDAQRVDPALSGEIQRAKRDLRDAEREVGDAKWNVVNAAWAAATAHENEAAALASAGDGVGYLRDQIWSLIDTYPELAPLLGALGGNNFAPTPLGSNFAGGYRSSGSLGSRASGGPVEAGRGYKVHPGETFWPGVSGFVQPAGGGTTVNIYMPPGSDGADVVNAVRQWERRNGSGWRTN